MRSPFANQAKGMIEPLNRSDGWWQPIMGGCGLPSGSRPSTCQVAIGSRHPLIADIVDPREGRSGRPELRHILIGNHHDLAALQQLEGRPDRYVSDADKGAKCSER